MYAETWKPLDHGLLGLQHQKGKIGTVRVKVKEENPASLSMLLLLDFTHSHSEWATHFSDHLSMTVMRERMPLVITCFVSVHIKKCWIKPLFYSVLDNFKLKHIFTIMKSRLDILIIDRIYLLLVSQYGNVAEWRAAQHCSFFPFFEEVAQWWVTDMAGASFPFSNSCDYIESHAKYIHMHNKKMWEACIFLVSFDCIDMSSYWLLQQ